MCPTNAVRTQAQTAPKEIRRFRQTGIGRAIACTNPSRSLCLDNARSRETDCTFLYNQTRCAAWTSGSFSAFTLRPPMPLARRHQARMSTMSHAPSSGLRFDRRSNPAYERPHEFPTNPAKRRGSPRHDHVQLEWQAKLDAHPSDCFERTLHFG